MADFDIGRQNTSTATGQPLLVEINGTLIGDTTFQINSYVHLKGDESNNLGTQFQYGGASSMGVNDYDPATTDTIPTLMILGNGINTIENLVFPYTDSYYGVIAIGSERDSIGCSNVSLKNVGVLMSDHPNAVGIKLYSTFWVWMEEIAVNAIGPVDTSIPPSSRAAIEIREDKNSNGTSSGFRYMENMVLNNGPLIISGNNDGTVGTHIESVDFENMRGSNLIIDTRSINFLGNLTFQQFTDHDRPAAWVGEPLVKILGNKARNIVFRDWSNALRVEGYCDNCQFINTDRPFEYSSANEQFKTGETVNDGTMSFNFGQYDGKVTQIPMSAFSSVMPGTPFPSLPHLGSELAALSNDSLTITAGFAGPNQDNEAVFCEPQITVDASNQLRILDQGSYTFRDGELILVSAWVRSACDTCYNQRFNDKAIFRISTDASGVTLNEVGTGTSSSNRLVNDPITGVTGQGWHLVSKVFEVSNPFSSTGRVILDLLYSQQDFYLYRPALVSLDESNNYTTRDLHRIAQTFSYYDDRANKGDNSIPGKRALLDGHYLVGLDLPFGTGNNRATYITPDSTISDMPITYDAVNNTINFFLNPPFSNARVNYRNTNSNYWLVQMQTTFNASNVNMQRFDGVNLNQTQEHFIRNFIGSNQSTNRGAYYGFHQNPEVSSGIPDTANAFYIQPIGSLGNFEFNGFGDFVLPTDGGIRFANDGVSILNGDSSPELNESAPVGSLYLRRSGSANPLYVKTTGTDSLGWAPVLVDPQVQTLTASGTYSKGSSHVVLDGTSAGVVLTLEATPSTGCKILEVVAKDITNAVSIDGNGNNINGAATYTFSAAYEGVTLFFDGTEWYAY